MLGVMGATLTTSLASQLPSLRFLLGVVVAARANGELVRTVEQLRRVLEYIAPGRPVVLQIERNGQFSFVAFDAD